MQSRMVYFEFSLLIIAFLCISFLSKSKGTPVISFQLNGTFTPTTYMSHSTLNFVQDGELDDFSLCLRFSLFYLRGFGTPPHTTYFFSYGTENSEDTLTGFIKRTDWVLEPYILAFCKHAFMNEECVEYPLPDLEFYKWYQVCLVYNHRKSEDKRSHLVNMDLYFDGKFVKSAKYKVTEFLPVLRKGIIILGQEQDALGDPSFFDENQAFSGELSQVEFWSLALDEKSIKALAECKQSTIFVESKLAEWNDSLERWENFNVEVRNSEIIEFCQPRVLQDYLIWAEELTYKQIFDYCRRMGGTLPSISYEKPLTAVHNEALLRFSQDPNNLKKCAAGQNKVKFWLNQPNITKFSDVSKFDCQYVFGDRVEKSVCTDRFPCGICKLPPNKLTLIKGVCGKDAESGFDFDFTIFGTRDGRPLFRGSQNSIMFYEEATAKWIVQSLRNPKRFVRTSNRLPEDLPIGTHNWEVTSDDAMCQLKKGKVLELTISQCYPNKYTCNNGDCIDLSDKCNTEIDCIDQSDEFYCDYLRFGENYASELVPRDESGNTLIVYMNVSVLAFPFIETIDLKFTADYFLNLKWYDLRIDFRDLNNVSSLNSLSRADQKAIWVPKLGFTNALGPFQTQVDELTSGVLVREDAIPLKEDITLSTESMLFSGRTNAIYLTREYYQDYACAFDLAYYPFDTQLCEMVFEVQGKTDNYVKLSKDTDPGIEFLSSRKLVEYEIQMEALEFKSVNNISQGIVKFVFRRNMEFHVTNTFLQTFLLVCVGYFSYFFDVDNFSDRIMVVLTTMLVLATVTTSIQSSLPKTSYYKMIDWWLLVSINIMIVTMGFHTFVAHQVSKATKRPMIRLPSAKSIFNRNKENMVTVETRPPTGTINRQDSRINKMLNSSTSSEAGLFANNPEAADALEAARRWNYLGKIVYVVLYVFFNIVFWITAISEYVRPAEEYISKDSVTVA